MKQTQKQNQVKNDSYYKSLDDYLRKVSSFNLYSFDTCYEEQLKKFECELLENKSDDFCTRFNIFVSLLVAHITEIRREDAFSVFMAGFKNGLEFYKHLKSKYNDDAYSENNIKSKKDEQ